MAIWNGYEVIHGAGIVITPSNIIEITGNATSNTLEFSRGITKSNYVYYFELKEATPSKRLEVKVGSVLYKSMDKDNTSQITSVMIDTISMKAEIRASNVVVASGSILEGSKITVKSSTTGTIRVEGLFKSSEWVYPNSNLKLFFEYVNKILISLGDGDVRSVARESYETPIMTSNTTPSGQVKASSERGESYAPWKAFDNTFNVTTGGWHTTTGSAINNAWLSYTFDKETKIDTYEIFAMNNTGLPRGFRFEGSNDEVAWKVLDEQNILLNEWVFDKWNTFKIPQERADNFKTYRIFIIDNNGGVITIIPEMRMMGVSAMITQFSSATEQNFINHGMDKPFELDMSQVFIQRKIFNEDGTFTIVETEPFILADEFEGKQVKILEYTDNPSQVESVVETETEPYSIYDEFGETMEVLYYTDDPDKSEAELEITANYSPLDEIDGDFEVVTWTDEDPAERILSLTALPKPQFIKQIDFNDVYGTITEFLTTESFSGTENGVIRYLLSPDRITWKTWTGSTFANIDVSNMSNIVANGIKKSILQSLTSSDWSKWIGQKLYLGIYLEEDIRDKTKAHIDTISYSDSVPKESTQISDAKLYILNTVSTINVSFAGSTLSGSIDDEDEGKVQYRVLLNDATYFPADGSFTPLMASPLDISLTIANKDVNIDENNTLRVEFKDYWGTVDYWQRNFVGSYSGLLFTDSTGEYYTTDIGEVLQYLDFGVIIAGQTTIEHEIILKNTYGYSVSDIKLYAKEGSFPSGMRAQFGTNLISFEALDVLNIDGVLHDGEEIPFYFRLSTQLGVTPPTVGEFDIVVVANKA